VTAPLTRFAPAPTGFLHLGHVVNAIYVWGVTGARRGRVLLRVEDHDRERCRPEYERALLDDLDWLGFAPDVYPTNAFRQGACESRQRERYAIYQHALDDLTARGLAYGCACSRQDISRHTSGATGERRYAGTCRDLGLPLTAGVGWRVRMNPELPSPPGPPGLESFVDGLLGPQTQDPTAQCGDILVRDRLGNWTYQFVASVDDFEQGIDLVIRGEDLLPSTGRQIRLARLLGRDAPATFLHHPLVMKSPTHKLSKADGDMGVRHLRAGGWTPEQLIGDAAWRVGLQSDRTPTHATEVARLFSASPVSSGSPYPST
jgi:glutamyl-tRNA synthetase/glutamyl-Q tRNA(Asp) synthetase